MLVIIRDLYTRHLRDVEFHRGPYRDLGPYRESGAVGDIIGHWHASLRIRTFPISQEKNRLEPFSSWLIIIIAQTFGQNKL